MIFDLWLPEAKPPSSHRVSATPRAAATQQRLVPARWPGTGTVAGMLLCLGDAMAAVPRWLGPVHIGISPADTPRPI
jgi:hypothetical protein